MHVKSVDGTAPAQQGGATNAANFHALSGITTA
jgi:hypothetical protein